MFLKLPKRNSANHLIFQQEFPVFPCKYVITTWKPGLRARLAARNKMLTKINKSEHKRRSERLELTTSQFIAWTNLEELR